jgi:glycosyltransferase involved in cell wall biosynthesis
LQAFNSLVAEFPDVYLKIFGYGRPSEMQKVKEDVKSLSLEGNVSLNGFTPDTTALIRNASVLVVPSQEYESFGLTIIEAMALGTPIVTTNVGGMPEVLAGSGAGYVCSKDNPLEFAGALKKILGDKELALELGRNGRLTFEQRYTSSKMAFSYMQILKNLY